MSLQVNNYNTVLANLKEKISQARIKTVLTANANMLALYWEIGNTILHQQTKEGWGAKIIDTLSIDLKLAFPDFKGLSVRNLKYMRSFAEAYPQFVIVQHDVAQMQTTDLQDIKIVQQAVAQLPWGHQIAILTKAKTSEDRLFYVQKCIDNNWGRDVLAAQIESKLMERTGNTINNFPQTLPAEFSDLANATFKNPYLFDFFAMGEKMQERDLERALINHLKKFMLELGKGFAYVGNQYNIVVEDDDFFLDLLFYNTHLHCYVVFELKIGAFKPEYAGKLNFYINTIDGQIKRPSDEQTVGILLCKTPNETVVKYALQNLQAPIGIAEYQLADGLPKQLKGEMLTIEELENELDEGYHELQSPSQKRFESLKEKLSALKCNEVKQIATTPILFETIEKNIVPMFRAILKRMEPIEEWFVSRDYYFTSKEGNKSNIDELQSYWQNEEFLKSRFDFNFTYTMNGFKKAGTDAFNIRWHIELRIDTYWYGITLANRGPVPILKKLYGEQLTQADIEFITDSVLDYVIESIDGHIDRLKQG